jgi:hypothetical protein
MKKRGQLTIFIILAIVIVTLILLYSVFKTNLLNQPIKDSELIKDQITNCLELNTQHALIFVSYQGGHNTPPEKHFSFSPSFFPYYYYQGENLMPTLKEIELEMSEFVKENLGTCLNEIKKDNFEVDYKLKQVDVKIKEEGVSFLIDLPTTLTLEDKKETINFKNNQIFYKSKLYHLYQISKFFIEDQQEDPENYCLSCIADLCQEYGIKFYIFPLIEDVYIVMAFENNENPLIFNFVNKYS